MLLQMICASSLWLLIGISLLRIWQVSVSGFAYVKSLHQIPCVRCVFFTGDYRLKCTVKPCTAMSEAAINCEDFQVN